MKKAKMMAAIAAAVIALNALCIPAAAVTVPDYGGDWTLSQDYQNLLSQTYGPFYTLGTDVSAYEPGDITMDGKVDLTDCIAIHQAYNNIVLLNANNFLTEDQIVLGDVLPGVFGKSKQFPVDPHDATLIQLFLNFRDVLEEPHSMEELAASCLQKRANGGKK